MKCSFSARRGLAVAAALASGGCQDGTYPTPPMYPPTRNASVLATATAPLAYVTNGFSNSVSVIATANNTVVATMGDIHSPDGVAITPNGAFAYVATGPSNISVIALATSTVVATLGVGSTPFGVAVTPKGGFIYVTNVTSNTVSVIATATNTVVATVSVGVNPRGVAISPDGAYAYVTCRTDLNALPRNSLWKIATATNTAVAAIPVSENPSGSAGVAITPDGAFAYIANGVSNTVTVVDIATYVPVATVPVGLIPLDVAITPDGAFAYVVNRVSDNVSVLATATNAVVSTVVVGDDPRAVAITPDGAFAYVANSSSNSVSVIATATNSVVATVSVGTSPRGVAIGTPTIAVNIDIKPGSDANPVNLRSHGRLPVAILSTAGFNALADVDRASLTFGRTGDEPSLASCSGIPEDVNGDGLFDLLCHIQTEQTGFEAGDSEGILKGRTNGGRSLEGKDAVRIVG